MRMYNVDTSILLDCFEKRGENGEYSLKFLEFIISTDSLIIYSDLHIRELKNTGYTYDQIIVLLSPFKKSIKKIHIYSFQLSEAKLIARQRDIPKNDALHAVLARDNNAIMISRDKHFQQIKDIVETRLPEDFT
ncbi:PIN domain-containing protein [Candidatus Woesearchaeota archaeon]|nr:PIN domain-containing protein [Candidatus Woesearchaeota archaeon]